MILLVIFIIQIVYVTLFTMRTIFVIRGRTYLAAGLSIAEIFVYISGLSIVLANLDNKINLVVYCLSYGLGIILGSAIEQKMALGYIQLQVITRVTTNCLPELFRAQGFGVTSWMAEGMDGEKQVLNILTKRKDYKSLEKLIKHLDPEAFMISHEPNRFFGGFLAKSTHNPSANAIRKILSKKKEKVLKCEK